MIVHRDLTWASGHERASESHVGELDWIVHRDPTLFPARNAAALLLANARVSAAGGPP